MLYNGISSGNACGANSEGINYQMVVTETGKPDFRAKLRSALPLGVKKGWGSFVWMSKIIVPISLLVALLQWSGWLYHVDFILNPVMRLINLPSEAALPIISGMLINIYAAIAVMSVLPFTIAQMTLIAVFALIAHNLIVEGIIQFRSGINIVKITLVRIIVAILTVLIVAQFIGDTAGSIAVSIEPVVDTPLVTALWAWATDALVLLSKIFLIIMGIMIILESLKGLEWDEYLVDFFRPVMKILGLSDRTAMLWVAAVVFGLMYSGAVIQEGVKRGDLTRAELEHLHISIGINHSVVEDPALFMALGLNGFWLWVPRLAMAVITVYIFRSARYLLSRISGNRSN